MGYAQTWQLSIQRDLPAAMQLTATYLGVKGTRGVQQFLPNTYPIGSTSLCPACPFGFVYQTSGGDSSRESAQLHLRRRLRSGLAASLLYTYSKSIDDDAYLGGQGHVEATSQNQGSTSPAPGQPESQLTTTQAQAPAPSLPSPRIGSTSARSVRAPPSINVTCLPSRPNTRLARVSAAKP